MIFKLENIPTITSLTHYFQINQTVIESFIQSEDVKGIKVISIKKYSGKFRNVADIENKAYRYILKVLTKYLNQHYIPNDSVFGYIKKRSIVDNAKKHLNKKTVIKFDIKDFFYSISSSDIKKVFISIGATENIAYVLSKLVTYQDILYPGLNTSPVLSNMYLQQLDLDYIELANKYGCDFSRYADDITISGNNNMPSINDIENILLKHNFKLNEKKYKVMKAGRYQVVTGLTVFDKNKPRIPRNKKRQIRLACFLRSKMDRKEYDKKVRWCTSDHLNGLLLYYNNIEPAFVKKMRELLKKTSYVVSQATPTPPID